MFYLQLSQTRQKYFGVTLKEKYDPLKIQKEFNSLKDTDQLIWQSLNSANNSLPLEQQFTFYIVKFERHITDWIDYRRRRVTSMSKHMSLKRHL